MLKETVWTPLAVMYHAFCTQEQEFAGLANYICKSLTLKINLCVPGAEIYRIHLYYLCLPESVYYSD